MNLIKLTRISGEDAFAWFINADKILSVWPIGSVPGARVGSVVELEGSDGARRIEVLETADKINELAWRAEFERQMAVARSMDAARLQLGLQSRGW